MTLLDPTARSGDFVDVTGGSLVVHSPETGLPAGAPVPVGTDPCVIGRGSGCHVIVDDREISLSHCELSATPDGVRVRDLGSTNGTFVGPAHLKNGAAAFLATHARLRCGQTWFSLTVAGAEPVAISPSMRFGPLIGRSKPMRMIFAQLAKLGAHELSVLITGETGTGKELVARAIHDNSRRAGKPFVVVDCTTIPAALAESKLFGHEKGAFTGAISRQPSPFVEAQGGTIFFDELGELPMEVQAKLLRALENRQIQSVGSTRYQPIDVRVVAATHRDLHTEINAKRFRNDLYFRFAHVTIRMPALRERTEDIPDLAIKFLTDLGDPDGMKRLDRLGYNQLERHEWPGNVRELRSVIMAAHALSEGGPLEVGDLLAPPGTARPLTGRRQRDLPFKEQKRELVEAFEREFLAELMDHEGSNIAEMSQRSGVHRMTLTGLLKRYGLHSPK